MKRVNNGNLILLLLCLCSFGLLLTGCKKSDFTFAPYEVEGQKKDTGLEIDEEMTLDGYLDEDVWTMVAENETVLTSEISEDVYMKVRCYLTEKGVYFGVNVYDTAVYYNKNRTASRNSSAEIYMKNLTSKDMYSLRLVPTGEEGGISTYKVTYLYDGAENIWKDWYMEWQGAANVQGTMNSGDCTGYTAEAFVPWSTLGGEPSDSIAYIPAFNHVETSSELDSARIWVGTSISQVSKYHVATNETVYNYASYISKVDETIVADEGMKVDGALNEKVWSKCEPMKFGFTTSTGQKLSFNGKYYAGEKGAYFGFDVKDPYLFYSPSDVRAIGLNTGMELFLAPAGTTEQNSNTLQLRITATNETARYRAERMEGNPWNETYVPLKSATKLHGTLNSEDVSKNTGYTIELFIPWDSLGLEETPEGMLLHPVLVHSEDIDNNAKKTPGWEYCMFYSTEKLLSAYPHNPSEQYLLMTDNGVQYRDLRVPKIVITENSLKGGYYYKTVSFDAGITGSLKNRATCDVKIVVPSLSLPSGITYTRNADSTLTLKVPASAVASLKKGLTYQAICNGVTAKGEITFSTFEQNAPVAHVNFTNGKVENIGRNKTVKAGAFVLNNSKDSTAFVETDAVNFMTGIDGTKNSAIATNYYKGAYTVLNNLNLNTNNFTISAWFRIPEYQTLSTGNSSYIFGTSKVDDTSEGFRATLREENDTFRFTFRTGKNDQVRADFTDFTYNTWHNLTVVREGATMKYYGDGKLLATEKIPANFSFGTKPLSFGAYVGEKWGYHNAKIVYDEIRVYDSAADVFLVRDIMALGKQ